MAKKRHAEDSSISARLKCQLAASTHVVFTKYLQYCFLMQVSSVSPEKRSSAVKCW